jgi:trimeric autotransporter adhesin
MLPKILRSLSPIAFVAAAFNFVAPAPLVAQATSSLVTTRLTQPIDESSRVTLKGTMNPLATAANDRGAASDSMPLDRLTLVLKRSDTQESALKQLISDLHTPGSASYHKWLTPDAFGKQFGPSDQDLATIQSWLASHGFSVTKVNAGRQSLEFSGNVSQFRTAFHTQIRKYMVNGEIRYANASDPQIPAALAPVVGGFASLNNFRPRNYMKVLGKASYDPRTNKATPEWTIGPGSPALANNYVLAPADFAIQYDLPSASSGNDGTGQTIAIVNDSNINVYLVNQYRSLFGLPANPPQVIIDGNDPGVNDDSGEAYLDVEISGAVAPNATIDLVIAADTALETGIVLAAERAVYGNIAPVVSVSFGLGCESELGSSGNAFLNGLWEQAAAQGITVMVSTGDSGSAGCDNDNTQDYAVRGLAVSGLASTPYNVAVGGTDFAYLTSGAPDSSLIPNYWNTAASNSSPVVSIKSVIPEQPWNNSQYGLNFFNFYNENGFTTIAGGSGGASTVYTTPSWQTGTGVPTTNHRYIPDISLFAATGANDSYTPLCAIDGDCQPASSGNTVQISGVGGTSASAPAFAGIMALVNQKYGRQGQADFVLYPLAAQFPAAFHDVVNGSISVPCNVNTTSLGIPPVDCLAVPNPIMDNDPNLGVATIGQLGTGTTPGYNATAGYDLATGLGTVDASVLIADWNKITFANASVMLTSPTAGSTFTHGSSVTFTASVAGTSPTGQVALMTDSTESSSQGIINATLSAGTASATTTLLPGGSYHVWAHYGGDGKNAENNSAEASISISPEASGIFLNIISPGNGTVASGTTNIPYGTPLEFSAQVAPMSQLAALEACFTTSSPCPVYGKPTGAVTFSDNSTKINTAVLNTEGDAEYNTTDQTVPVSATNVGSHSITASYAGDNSYNASSASASTYTITKGDTNLEVGWPNQNLYAGQVSTITVIVQTSGVGAPPTGTISVSGAPSGTTTSALSYSGVDAQTGGTDSFATITFPSSTGAGNYNVTISYSGDGNYNSTQGQGQIQFLSKPSQTPTTTVITTTRSSTSPSTLVGITVTVTGSGGTTPPTGTITLITSSGAFQPLTLSPNSGSNNTSSISIGVDSSGILQGSNLLTAGYSGDSHYAPSTSAAVNLANPLSDFAMVPETTTVPVTAGSLGTDTINVSSVNGFSGAVSFSCTTSTISCSVTPSATLSGGSTSALTLTINAGSSTPNDSYNILVTGKDSTGTYIHTLAIQAFVTGSANTPGFNLSANPSALTLSAGATTGNTSTITVTPVNTFTGTVNLTYTVSGPSGATSPPTITFVPPSPLDITGTTPVTTVATVATTSTTTPGNYTITINGAAGTVTESTTITVAVPTPTFALSANPTAVSITAGSSGTLPITVTPSNGFTGNVALTCSTSSSTQVTCSLNPTTVDVMSGAVMSTITIAAASNSAALDRPLNKFFAIGGGATLALLVFFGIPARRRSWRAILGVVLFGALVGIGIGCGGSGNGGGGGGSANYTVTVTGTSGSLQPQTTTINVTATSN